MSFIRNFVSRPISLENVAALSGISFEPMDGQLVQVLGYYAPGDAGHAWDFIYHSTGRTGVTIDNGFYHVGRDADDYFEATDKTVANYRRFGAVSDWDGLVGGTGTDNATVTTTIGVSAAAEDCPVYIPKGDYYTSASFSNIGVKKYYGDGEQSRIYNDTTFGFNMSQSRDLTISDLSIVGSNTGLDIAGVRFWRAENSRVLNCHIRNWGASGATFGGNGIAIEENHGEVVIQNNFFEGNEGDRSADIQCSSRKTIITGNICLSPCSEGINFGSSSSDGGFQPARAIVSNNICIGHDRHGILCSYGNEDSQSIISNNICTDNGWTGIYGQAAEAAADNGNFVITGNVITRCGGNQGSNVANSGIYFNGDIGAVISNNVINDCGYDPVGALYQESAPGIWLQSAENVVVTGNKIMGCSGGGITTEITPGKRIRIENNVLKDNDGFQIWIHNNVQINEDIVIANNTIVVETKDAHGIIMTNANTTEHGIMDVVNNKFVCLNGTSTKAALNFTYPPYGEFSNNSIRGTWQNVVYAEPNFSTTHLEWGKDFRINNNTCEDITGDCFVVSGPAGIYFIIGNNHFDNCPSISNGAAVVLEGVIEHNNRVRANASAAPATGAWQQGDTLYDTTPSAGGTMGWVCTAAGSPGTWKTFGAIEA